LFIVISARLAFKEGVGGHLTEGNTMEKNELLHLRENLAKAAKRFEDSERRDAASLKELAKEIPIYT
jgi:hypothetical protein